MLSYFSAAWLYRVWHLQCLKGIGKVKPIKVLQKNAKFNAMLARRGDNWEILDDMLWDAEELTCVLFGKPRFKTVNELRFHLLKAKCGSEDKITNNTNIEITNMPPFNDSLREHVRRVTYGLVIWKRVLVTKPDMPNPSTVHGWVFWRMMFLSPCGWVVNTSITNSRYSKCLRRWWGTSQCRVRYGQKIWAASGIWIWMSGAPPPPPPLPNTHTLSPITYIMPPGNWTLAICGTVQCSYVTLFIQLNTILNIIRLLIILNFLSLIYC